jgi:hypothetical protein
VTGNRGCGIQETATPNSLGAGFAQNGGGVYAMYWSTSGIQMWFFGVRALPPPRYTSLTRAHSATGSHRT